jgi:hypothetical protein
MNIDPRFQRACESERLRATRKEKENIGHEITSIIRSSPLYLARKIKQYAHEQKLELLERQ